MSLVMRGVVFREGEIIQTFANLDPALSETYRVELAAEPGDVIYVVDDTLTVHEFDLLRHTGGTGGEARFTEAHVRRLTPARFEVVVTGAAPEGAQLWWTITGRQGQGTIEVRTPGETLVDRLWARAKGVTG